MLAPGDAVSGTKAASSPGRVSERVDPLTHPVTPDGRYFVVRGRLWRRFDPSLPNERRASPVAELMAARRRVGGALRSNDPVALANARAEVDCAKIALGERGPVWWGDGAPDLNRHMAATTGYAEWFGSLEDAR